MPTEFYGLQRLILLHMLGHQLGKTTDQPTHELDTQLLPSENLPELRSFLVDPTCKKCTCFVNEIFQRIMKNEMFQGIRMRSVFPRLSQ